MDLFLAAIQVVPMLFIALFLDRRNGDDPADEAARRTASRLRFFHLLVASLGLIAFSLSVYVVGADIEPQGWMRSVVTAALACSMAALATQIFLTLTAKR